MTTVVKMIYFIQNKVCRQHMDYMINRNFEASKEWIGQEFRLEMPVAQKEVPLTLVKAVLLAEVSQVFSK